MTEVVVTTTDPDGWWWGGAGVLVPTDDTLITVTLPAFAARSSGTAVAAQAFAVHLSPGAELAARFARQPYDFDGLAVERGFGDVPLLSAVSRRLYCHVARTVTTGDEVRVYGFPAEEALAA